MKKYEPLSSLTVVCDRYWAFGIEYNVFTREWNLLFWITLDAEEDLEPW